MFVCGAAFDIFQDGVFRRYNGELYDPNTFEYLLDPNGLSIVHLGTPAGEPQCGYIQNNTIFKLTVWDFLSNLADLNLPFTLYFGANFTEVEHPIFSIDMGGSSLVSQPIINQSPVADYSISPLSAGQAPFTITLDATPSFDPDGTITNYEWLVNGQILSGKNVTTTLETAGTYTTKLTVTDNQGATATKSLSVIVNHPIVENQLPIANYIITPNTGQAPLTVTLDAGISSDPDGSIADYQWSVNGQTLSGKTVSVTLDKAGNYPITLIVTDDKGLSATKANSITVIQPTQSNSEFCASGNVNIDLTGIKNCVNGNCSSPGVKIACNSQNCQWCDASNNCGNVLYTGVTSIPSGSISCTNGQCSYSIQAGGINLSDSFSCEGNTSQPTTVDITPVNTIETINPVVSKSIYQDGDQITITIPKTVPVGQSQYFGIELPNDMGLFLANDLNNFYPFDGSNLLEWQGEETAIDISVTPDLPRGKYTTYLLRSLKGIDPFKASENQSSLGTNGFVIMNSNQSINPSTGKASAPTTVVTPITDTQTDLGMVVSNVNQKELITIRGGKNTQGNLTSVKNITYVAKDDPSKSVNINFGDGVTAPELTIETSDGIKIEYGNHDPVKKTATMRVVKTDDTGNEIEVAKLEEQPMPDLSRLNPPPTESTTEPNQLDTSTLASCHKTADLSDMITICLLNDTFSLLNKIAETFCGVSENIASSGGLSKKQGDLSKLIIGLFDFAWYSQGHKGSVCKPISDVPESGTDEPESPATTCYTDPLNDWPESSLAVTECLKTGLIPCGSIKGIYELFESTFNLFGSMHKMMSPECKNSCSIVETNEGRPQGCHCESHEGTDEYSEPINLPIGFEHPTNSGNFFLRKITYCSDPECGRRHGVTNYTEIKTWQCK